MLYAKIHLILTLGVLLLGAGSFSMIVVRVTSTGLQGMGRFGLAFAAGMLGSGLQMVRGLPVLSILGTDLSLLSSFVLIHLAVLRLAQMRAARLWHGLFLLGLQATVDLCCLHGSIGQRFRVTSLGLLVAVQTITTIATLWPLLRGPLRAPAAYCISLLSLFSAIDLLRSVVMGSGRGSFTWNQWLGFLAFVLFLMTELGLAFGFFWMTTANLTTQVEHAASTDPLTRVFNRRVFLKWCEKELLRSQRLGVPFSVLMVDLDHFKKVNDNFGHQRGDEVLVAAVERMQDSVRGIDVLCRWGGEEFAVLLPSASADATRIVAERIRENISRMEVALEPDSSEGIAEGRLTASIGAATYRDLDDNISAMLQRADRALYGAKGAGRNRVLIGA